MPATSEMADSRPFWERKTLQQMSSDEWESLCDGCAQCCLVKLEDEDTGERFMTRIACRQLDLGTCRCKDYSQRHATVPDCLALTPENIGDLDWLPETCAYVLIANGQPLAWWHPLVSGSRETVHQAGMSIKKHAVSERGIKQRDFERYIVSEP